MRCQLGVTRRTITLVFAIPVLAALLGAAKVAAQQREPDGGEAFIPPRQVPCLTDEQRQAIRERLTAARERLHASGKLPPARAGSIVLFDWPLRKAYNLSDFGYHGISNFVDQDSDYPGELLDYNCGMRTYDLPSGYNHQGIDYFSYPFSWYKMDNSLVEIVAAAPGVILDKDDGNDDRSCGFGGGDWNAVFVEHADGSVAWYGHMKSGSQTSKEDGDPVAAGEFLGVVGSSGNSTGPHLHFEVYDADDNLVEPYFGPCNAMNESSWWAAQRPYYDSAINALLTHDAAPVFPACPQQEVPNDRDAFLPGEAIIFAGYYRDILDTQTTQYSVLRPDNSVAWSWSYTSSEPYYPAAYVYWNDTLPGDAPTGTWTLRAVYEGTTYDHPFRVCDSAGDPPVVTCPSDLTVECTTAGGTPRDNAAILAFLQGASATGACDVTPWLVNDGPSFFPLGKTTVTFTATDDFGAQGSCTATVTIEDTTPPEIVCPQGVTVECTEGGGTPATNPVIAAFLAGATATDICDANPTVGPDNPPALFPVGETQVTFVATDESGQTSTCVATVTVEDTTPPTISVELNRYILWPPNHKLMTITAAVEVADICDPDPALVLTGITSDEPDNGLGDGDQPNDIQQADFGTEDLTFLLRAERSGSGDGRVYTIVYTVTDESGNATTATVYVEVPFSQAGSALAGEGFSPDGEGPDPEAAQYSLVIAGSVQLDVEEIIAERVQVGNDVGALLPISSRTLDANADGRTDLEVVFNTPATIELAKASAYPFWMIYQEADGVSFEVPEVFAAAGLVTGLDSPSPEGPTEGDAALPLLRPVPNPFRTSTRFSYAVSSADAVESGGAVSVRIQIYDVAGRQVRSLLDNRQSPGTYTVTWDRRSDDGVAVSSGVYLQRISIGGRSSSVPLIVLD